MSTRHVDEIRRILSLAWPVMLVSLNWTILQVTDIIFVGNVSLHEAAGFGASRAISFIAIVSAIGALSGVLVNASRADGAGDMLQTGDVLRTGLLLSLLIGLIGGLLLFFAAAPLLRLVGVAADQLPISTLVVKIMALAFPAQLIVIGASNFLEGISQPRRVMIVNLSILPFNAVLAWGLTSGTIGLPARGAAGAALATMIAVWVGATGMVVSALRLRDHRQRGVRDWSAAALARAWRDIGALARFGLVPAIASMLELAGFSWLIGLSTQLGEVATHAFQIVFSIHNVTFAVALGLGSAAGVRAGNAVGEGASGRAYSRTLIAAALTLIVMTLIAGGLVLFGAPLVRLFPAVADVHRLGIAMLALWAPFVIFDGLQVVFMFALRSIGDQVAAGINGIIAFFLVTGCGGWLLVAGGAGPFALVWGSGLGMLAAATLNGTRFWWVNAPRRHPKS